MKQEIQLSVIVCCYNRVQYIEEVIRRLSDQTFDKSAYEILLVDNNSNDGTAELCKEGIAKYPENNIRYFLETNQGLTFARNRGVRESEAPLVTFIDDDGFCNENYIAEFIKAFEKYPNAQVLGGKVIPIFPECDPPKWSSKYLDGVLSKLDIGDQEKEFEKKYPIGCNMGYRKSVLEKVGGFNEDLVLRSDEKDLFHRLKQLGTVFMYIPSIYVEHVIGKGRVSKAGVIKISRITGEGEYYRNKRSFGKLTAKFFEYLFKFGASVLIAISYLFKGERMKAHYVIMARYHVLGGFLNAKRTLNSGT